MFISYFNLQMILMMKKWTVKVKGRMVRIYRGVFDAVPSKNSDLIPPGIHEVFDELPFSPIEETPPVTRQQLSPPATVTSSRDTANISTTVEVSADVHVSVGTNFDLDTTPTG